MKQTRFSENLIFSIFKQASQGISVVELCREHGMSSASFYKWRARYGGMDALMIGEMKDLEAENKRITECIVKPFKI